MTDHLTNYLLASYRDPMFLLFPVYTSLYGLFLYLAFALPLSALAHWNPVAMRRYLVNDKPIDVPAFFLPSLRKLFAHNLLLFAVLVAMWPLTRQFGVHAGPMPVWYIAVAQILLFLYVDDFLTFWVHRALHRGWLYRKVHSVHHQVRHPSAMDNAYFHWAEFLMLMSTGMLLPVLMGAHIGVIWIWLTIRIWQSVGGHSGYVFPWDPVRLAPLYEGGDFHYHHHTDPRGNLSGILPYLDRYFGRISPSYARYKAAGQAGRRRRFLKLDWSAKQ